MDHMCSQNNKNLTIYMYIFYGKDRYMQQVYWREMDCGFWMCIVRRKAKSLQTSAWELPCSFLLSKAVKIESLLFSIFFFFWKKKKQQ